MAARRRGIWGKTMNGKAKQLEEDVPSFHSLGIGTNFLAEITKVLFLNSVPLRHHKMKHDYSMGANFQVISETLIYLN
jgi:hypothetical protein